MTQPPPAQSGALPVAEALYSKAIEHDGNIAVTSSHPLEIVAAMFALVLGRLSASPHGLLHLTSPLISLHVYTTNTTYVYTQSCHTPVDVA